MHCIHIKARLPNIALESKRTRPVEKSSTPTVPNLYLEISSSKHLQHH